jgi:hypothetical protein
MEIVGRIRIHGRKMSMSVKIHKTRVPVLAQPRKPEKPVEKLDAVQTDLF